MSEYLIQDTTLTNIANPLRTLGETTGTKTPAQMATIVTNANTTITTQGTLLDEVIEALEGKISPPVPSLPTCIISYENAQFNTLMFFASGADGNPVSVFMDVSRSGTVEIMKNSIVYMPNGSMDGSDNVEYVDTYVWFVKGDANAYGT